MLCLTRRNGEAVLLTVVPKCKFCSSTLFECRHCAAWDYEGGAITITVESTAKVRLHFDATPNVKILRAELQPGVDDGP